MIIMKLLSICIPTYEMKGSGHVFLKHTFTILSNQTFKDFEIIISDHSKNDEIKNLCDIYKEMLDIKYYKNNENIGNSSANINNAMKKAKGKLVKILFQDDFLYDEKSLEVIVSDFNLTKDHWLVTACAHTRDGMLFFKPHYPKYNKNIHLGKNTIGSPSVLTIKNENPLFFDEKLIWLMDCDYYKRCYNAYGLPKVIDDINVVIGVGEHQVTNTKATFRIRQAEYQYILDKYETGWKYWLYKILAYIMYPIIKLKYYL